MLDLEQMQQMADEAVERERARRLAIQRLDAFIAFKQAKKRRRKLGQNGYSKRRMGFPKGKHGMQA